MRSLIIACAWGFSAVGCRIGYDIAQTRQVSSGVAVDGAPDDAPAPSRDVDLAAGGSDDAAAGGSDAGPDDAPPPDADAVDDGTAPLADAAPDVEAEAGVLDLVVDFADTARVARNGSAVVDAAGLDLTTGAYQQAGSAYLAPPYAIGPSTVFSVFFTFRLYGSDAGTGGDGIALVWQNDPAGPAALGLVGAGLGYEGVTPSVDVKLRTAMSTVEDPSDNYVAINQGGTRTALATNTTLPFDLNDGASHNVWVDYAGATKTLTVYLADTTTKPGTPTLTASVDLAALVGATAYLGLTGSTGAFADTQAIEAMTVHYQY